MTKPKSLAAIIAATLVLGACSMAPTYKPPEAPVAEHYQSAGPWTTAQPSDQLPREGWWTLYGDERLNGLEQQLIDHNPDLAAAFASYQQSRDYLAQVRADLFPQISVGAGAQRNRASLNSPLHGPTSPEYYDLYSATAQASYEVDLWGRVRDNVAAGRASMQASAADLASVRLSLEASLADSYVQLVGVDRQIDLLQKTVDAYQRALQLTTTLHEGGAVSGLDVDRAQTQLASTRSQLSQTKAQRDVLLHAIASLVGQPASSFTLDAKTDLPSLPVIPVGLPSTLLERRPDIAAAERRTAEANAQIGVARSAFFPSLTLSANGGYTSGAWGNLLNAPSTLWALGPNLLLNVFDGGRRRAQVASAHAAFDEASARYRSTALAAFQQVEDNQSLLKNYGNALVDQQDATAAADRTLKLSTALYKQGANSYLDVVTAQVDSLNAHLGLLSLQTNQLRASVQLVRALGGGWQSDDIAVKQLAVDAKARGMK
ncbi:efflux transporter, outer membrane factor (OMF) lipoprotein, NodT family [Dyella jiangningensis]|uniref:efflux transporter outer membrane subunit n=1 Tax=Dyella sp. AtDHG13 TaxID=1938897 RepID=UPI000883B936|nr:efflux transporter outer membrane subunit [Dyella sp. AtDHG13]PXV57373.1 NodT family efflux transporter outer membrane factor (OMF) lipoprotein [Dyella sp. AtDHG13]SDK42218.1 efflux transporter, outer membrane factor (OMF) lipoprotein, NodT family [Dyella jiangningensis]